MAEKLNPLNPAFFISRSDEESTHPIEFVGQKWPRLSYTQYLLVEAELRKQRRTHNLAIAKECGLSAADMALFLQRSDPFDVSMGEVNLWCDSLVGANAVLSVSLKSNGASESDAKTAIDNVNLTALGYLARLTLGFLPVEGQTNPLTSGTGAAGSPLSDTTSPATTPTK